MLNKQKRQKIYKSKAWRDIRKLVIARQNYVCAICKRPVELHIHHIDPLTDDNYTDDSIAYNPDNLIGLCVTCHNYEGAETKPLREGLAFDQYGNMVNKEGS